MKIHHRLFLTFAVIALLAGVVALYALNATRQIIHAFEGGEEHFQQIIVLANEVGSQAKRAQSHLLLYLGLGEDDNRREFFRRYRTILQEVVELREMARDPEALRIVDDISRGVDNLFQSAQAVLAAYDQAHLTNRVFDPGEHGNAIRRFFTATSGLMRDATRLANLETDFLNKQYAILNATTINNLVKVCEGQLLLYMLLNDQRDLERYLVGINSLESTLKALQERVRDDKATYLLNGIQREVAQFKASGEALFQAFHGEQQRAGRVSLRDYSSKVLDFHDRSANIRELAVRLSNLMSEQEFEKREAALDTAVSIERSLVFFVVVGGLLTLLLGYFLSVSIAQPLVKLKEAAARIGKGDLDAAEHLRGRGEIGSLIETFRAMANDLKDARNQLVAAKEYADNILGSMSDALCVIGPDCRVRTANRAMYALLGYGDDELVGIPFAELFATAPPVTCRPGHLSQDMVVRPLVTSFATKEGEPVYVSFSSSLMYGGDGGVQGLVCVAQDMTSRRKAMQELRLLATVVEQAAEAIVVCDPTGVIQYVNPAFETITGYQRDEAVGQPMSILKSGVHDEAFYRDLWTTIGSGRVWSGRITNRRKDGTLYEEECTISPVYDEARTIVNYVALKRDVTREAKLERQLQQSQKHQALGTLAGGIAHDFNNILGAMLAFAEASQAEVAPDSRVAANLQEIVSAGRRAADLVHQILTFSRPAKGVHRPVALPPLVNGVLNMVRSTLPADIAIDRQVDRGCRPVLGDATQLQQVLLNLCTNAGHAVRGQVNGRILVRLEEVTVDQAMAGEHTGLHPGPYARLSVADNGCGMDSATLERIFEPYFTTKPVGEGTGLGLATVHGIVEGHGGVILVDSAPGRGAEFTVYLPIVDREAVEEQPPPPPPPPPAAGRILFVDDEAIILQSMKMVLSQMGCRVTAFAASEQALEAFRREPDGFDLVITDQTMPGLTGMDLIRAIREMRPDIPVILTTGYSQTVDEEEAGRQGVDAFMMKPLQVEALRTTVARLLGRQGPGP